MASATEGAVSILDRRVVGVFDTTTIASQDPKALGKWLSENGFALSADARPAIESYVKEGWVFVAAKIRRDHGGLANQHAAPAILHVQDRPAGLSHAPDRYRQRSVARRAIRIRPRARLGAPLQGRAVHPACLSGTERAVVPLLARDSQYRPSPAAPMGRGGSPVATKLTATLSPADMRQDVWLEWSGFRQRNNVQFSRAGALTYSLNRGAGLFAAALFLALLAADVSQNIRRDLGKLAAGATIAGAVLTGSLYLSLQKTEVRVVRMPGIMTQYSLDFAYGFLIGETNLTAATARAILAGPTDSHRAAAWEEHFSYGRRDNLLLGGAIREEDSPGQLHVPRDCRRTRVRHL